MEISIKKNNIQRSPNSGHRLMYNNVTQEDFSCLIDFLSNSNSDLKLTQGSQVRAFEKEWSEWLGVKHSVFVHSGSAANLLTIAILKTLYGTGEIIVPPLTWVSDIAACLQNGFTPVFVDIDPKSLAMDSKQILRKITPKTKAVFLTHVQGFNGLTDNLLDALASQDIPLIEDVCEAHGATHRGRKLGGYGLMSNFSFYFAHHMTTIEGGMICTNDDDIYQMILMYRSHGMVREANSPALQEQYAKNNPMLNPDFIFAFPAYNVRNTEIGAVLGRNQLKRLDENNLLRNANHKIFLNHLDPERFWTGFDLVGSSNYAFNAILNKPDWQLRDRIELVLRDANVEYRRGSAGGGNQMRQPYLAELISTEELASVPEVEHVHSFGWYIGNYPSLEKEKILLLCKLLNNA